MDDLVQLKNPKTGRYVKVNRTVGVIVSTKATLGPYKGIPVVSINSCPPAVTDEK